MKIIFYLIAIMFCMASCNEPEPQEKIIIIHAPPQQQVEKQSQRSDQESLERTKLLLAASEKRRQETLQLKAEKKVEQEKVVAQRKVEREANRAVYEKQSKARRDAYGLEPLPNQRRVKQRRVKQRRVTQSKVTQSKATQSEVNQSEVNQQRLALAFDYDGETYKTEWVWDYVIVNGKFYFAVSVNGVKGLLDTKRINIEKTEKDAYATAKKFAQYIKAKAKHEAQTTTANVKKRKDAEWGAKAKDFKYQKSYRVRVGSEGLFKVYFQKDVMSSRGLYSWSTVFSCTMTDKDTSGLPLGKFPHRSRNEGGNLKAYSHARSSVTLYSGAQMIWYLNKEDAIQSRLKEMK